VLTTTLKFKNIKLIIYLLIFIAKFGMSSKLIEKIQKLGNIYYVGDDGFKFEDTL